MTALFLFVIILIIGFLTSIVEVGQNIPQLFAGGPVQGDPRHERARCVRLNQQKNGRVPFVWRPNKPMGDQYAGLNQPLRARGQINKGRAATTRKNRLGF